MRRRWLQFSLRSFFSATSAFAIWLGLVAEKAMRQQDAVARLDGWGAHVVYEHQWRGPSTYPNLQASAQESKTPD